MQRPPSDIPPAASIARAQRHYGRIVLLSSDSPATCGALASELTALGCLVVGPFTTNRAALMWVDEMNVADIALLDINLADGSSVSIAQALTREGMPLIFFSRFDARQRVLHAEHPGRPGEFHEHRAEDLLDLCCLPEDDSMISDRPRVR